MYPNGISHHFVGDGEVLNCTPATLRPDYMASHWVPTFALYLISQRGLAAATPGRQSAAIPRP